MPVEVPYGASDGNGGIDSASIFIVIPDEVVEIGVKLAEEVGTPLINFDVPDGIEILTSRGVELLTGAFFQSLEVLRVPLILLLIAFLWSILLGGFRWSMLVRLLPFLGGAGRRYAVVMLDPESVLTVYEGPTDQSAVVHNFGPTTTDLLGISRVRRVDGIDWIKVESERQVGWLTSTTSRSRSRMTISRMTTELAP